MVRWRQPQGLPQIPPPSLPFEPTRQNLEIATPARQVPRMVLGMTIGIALGAALGLSVLDNAAIGIALGIAMGSAAGHVWTRRRR